jgi:gamma-glutamylcyclotransferase (GGCT)/AIG2-like uncharacterized protein YtfP
MCNFIDKNRGPKVNMTRMRQKRSEILFVYGSLLSSVRGRLGAAERRALRWHSCRIGFGVVPGRLHDLGGYPGLAISRRISEVVHGEVWRVIDSRRLWPVLDTYEGLDCTPPQYARGIVTVRVVSGQTLTADVYRPLANLCGTPRAPRGRWRG